MFKRGRKETVFVCCAISISGKLITKEIVAASVEEAATLFLEQEGLVSQETFGPFYKKKIKIVIDESKPIKFSSQTKKAIYHEWEVNAFILLEPADYAYLIFNKRTDGKKVPAPKGTVVVPITDLRIIENGK